jgi:hypothetical protein
MPGLHPDIAGSFRDRVYEAMGAAPTVLIRRSWEVAMANRPPDGGDGGRRLEPTPFPPRPSHRDQHRRPSLWPTSTSKMPKRGNPMMPPDDVGEIAKAFLADGEAPVRVRTVAARVHYRRLFINRWSDWILQTRTGSFQRPTLKYEASGASTRMRMRR